MEKRSEDILEAAIQEFIKSGDPVSSERLYELYDFGIKPASIRIELTDLTDQGFLEQPHHSAGRVPTDRGYEFFLQKINPEPGIDREMVSLMAQEAWHDLLLHISTNLGVVGAVMNRRELFYKGLLENLIEHLNWESRETIRSVIRDFEELDDKLKEADDLLKEKNFIKTYIGRKSPLTETEDLAVLTSDYDVGGERYLMCLIGPKRMNYEKAVKILKGLKLENK